MMSLLGDLIGGGLGLLGQQADLKAQEKAAKHSIRWRVADAQKAGISPLYALGAPTMQFQSNYGGLGQSVGQGFGDDLENMGQDITRARAAGMDAPERGATGMMLKLQLERGGLENELLRRRISQIAVPGTPGQQPNPVIPGQAPLDPDAKPMGIVLPNGVVMDSGASSPANTWEQQYGDVVQNAAGMWRLGVDGYRRFVKPYVDRAYESDYSTRVPPRNSGYPRYGGYR